MNDPVEVVVARRLTTIEGLPGKAIRKVVKEHDSLALSFVDGSWISFSVRQLGDGYCMELGPERITPDVVEALHLLHDEFLDRYRAAYGQLQGELQRAHDLVTLARLKAKYPDES